jgi:hypothetical protein
MALMFGKPLRLCVKNLKSSTRWVALTVTLPVDNVLDFGWHKLFKEPMRSRKLCCNRLLIDRNKAASPFLSLG